MARMASNSRLAGRFGRDERGAVAIAFALVLVLVCGVVGLAFDGMRAYRMKTRVGAAIDAAALAGAKLLNRSGAGDGEVQAAVNAVLAATNVELQGLWVTLGQPRIVINRVDNTVAIDIDVAVPTVFARLIGVANLDFVSATKVAYKIQALELAMVLDVTGSMNNNGKITAMKTSAGAVIDTLLTSTDAPEMVRIGVAPFSAAVNAGSFAARVSGSPSSIDRCVVERLGPAQFTDAPPDGPDAMRWFDPMTTGGSHYTCPAAEIVPLTDNPRNLKDTIAGYVADGWTAGHIGAAWGWYLLSPRWGSVWPRPPGAYSDRNVVKAMILLTDGIFNTSYTSGLTTPDPQQVTQSYAQLAQLCTNIKAAGITVYTIALDLNDATALDALRGCASSASRAFESPSATQLESVFMRIVQDLNVLRVVE